MANTKGSLPPQHLLESKSNSNPSQILRMLHPHSEGIQRMADQMDGLPNNEQELPVSPDFQEKNPDVQRKCLDCEEGEEKEILQKSEEVQAKLEIGKADDPKEREADAVAKQVMKDSPSEPEAITASPKTVPQPVVQAKECTDCEETVSEEAGAKEEGEIQRKESASAPPEEPGDKFEIQLASSMGGGFAMPRAVLVFMEDQFGHDFKQVRIHADRTADELCRSINARAFTYGRHIFFKEGEWAPFTAVGRELLAHELTHTIQQGKSPALHIHRKSDAEGGLAEELMDCFRNIGMMLEGSMALDACEFDRLHGLLERAATEKPMLFMHYFLKASETKVFDKIRKVNETAAPDVQKSMAFLLEMETKLTTSSDEQVEESRETLEDELDAVFVTSDANVLEAFESISSNKRADLVKSYGKPLTELGEELIDGLDPETLYQVISLNGMPNGIIERKWLETNPNSKSILTGQKVSYFEKMHKGYEFKPAGIRTYYKWFIFYDDAAVEKYGLDKVYQHQYGGDAFAWIWEYPGKHRVVMERRQTGDKVTFFEAWHDVYTPGELAEDQRTQDLSLQNDDLIQDLVIAESRGDTIRRAALESDFPEEIYNEWKEAKLKLFLLVTLKDRPEWENADETARMAKKKKYRAEAAEALKKYYTSVRTKVLQYDFQNHKTRTYTGSSYYTPSSTTYFTDNKYLPPGLYKRAMRNLDNFYVPYSTLLVNFAEVVSGMDKAMVQALRASKNPSHERQGDALEYFGTLSTELMSIYAQHPSARKIPAIFYPTSEQHLDNQKKKNGDIDLRGVPLNFYVFKEGSTWHLRELTNPMGKKLETTASGESDTDPPKKLFDNLDTKYRFPKGYISFTYPSGKQGHVETTEPMEISEIAFKIGTLLAVVALVASTGGAGSVVVSGLVIASSAVTVVGAAADIIEKNNAGVLTEEDILVDLLMVGACIAGALKAAAPLVVKNVATSLVARQLVGFTKSFWVPLTVIEGTSVVTSMAVFTDQFLADMEAIEKIKDPVERKKQRDKLVNMAIIGGAMTVISLRGTFKDIQSGQGLTLTASEVRPTMDLDGGPGTGQTLVHVSDGGGNPGSVSGGKPTTTSSTTEPAPIANRSTDAAPPIRGTTRAYSGPQNNNQNAAKGSTQTQTLPGDGVHVGPADDGFVQPGVREMTPEGQPLLDVEVATQNLPNQNTNPKGKSQKKAQPKTKAQAQPIPYGATQALTQTEAKKKERSDCHSTENQALFEAEFIALGKAFTPEDLEKTIDFWCDVNHLITGNYPDGNEPISISATVKAYTHEGWDQVLVWAEARLQEVMRIANQEPHEHAVEHLERYFKTYQEYGIYGYASLAAGQTSMLYAKMNLLEKNFNYKYYKVGHNFFGSRSDGALTKFYYDALEHRQELMSREFRDPLTELDYLRHGDYIRLKRNPRKKWQVVEVGPLRAVGRGPKLPTWVDITPYQRGGIKPGAKRTRIRKMNDIDSAYKLNWDSNFAFFQFYVGNKPIEAHKKPLVAVSGYQKKRTKYDFGDGRGVFSTVNNRGKKGDHYPIHWTDALEYNQDTSGHYFARNSDSEVKILNYVRVQKQERRFEGLGKMDVYLYTDRITCESCTDLLYNVRNEFREDQIGKINIIYTDISKVNP